MQDAGRRDIRACALNRALCALLFLAWALGLAACHGSGDEAGNRFRIEILSGDGQTGEAGKQLAGPLVVRVTQADGAPAAGLTVRFEVEAGGGALSASSGTSDENGSASVTWTLGSPPVLNRVTAAIPGGTVRFQARAEPGEPPPLELIHQGPAGFASEDLAFRQGRGLFLGIEGGVLNMPAPGEPVTALPITGEPVYNPLGIAFGLAGNLYLCENFAPVSSALKRITPTGACENLSTGFDGKPFDLPNYIAVHSSGEIFLSSTCNDMIYSVSPLDGETREFLSITAPNGIAFSQDESFLYILTENPLFFCRGPNVPGGLYRVALGPDKAPGEIETLVADFAVAGDGLAFDAEGNLYVVFTGIIGGSFERLLTSGIFVYTPDGRFEEYVSVNLLRDIFTNIAFGIEPFDPHALYAYGFTGRVYRIEVGIRGLTLP